MRTHCPIGTSILSAGFVRYPGHKSYSLAALCENHGIALREHHRALGVPRQPPSYCC